MNTHTCIGSGKGDFGPHKSEARHCSAISLQEQITALPAPYDPPVHVVHLFVHSFFTHRIPYAADSQRVLLKGEYPDYIHASFVNVRELIVFNFLVLTLCK